MFAPTEANCCHPWFNKICDPDDTSELLKFSKFIASRNMYGILNDLKHVQCMIGSRETSGFDIPLSELGILERGKEVPFIDNVMNKRL